MLEVGTTPGILWEVGLGARSTVALSTASPTASGVGCGTSTTSKVGVCATIGVGTGATLLDIDGLAADGVGIGGHGSGVPVSICKFNKGAVLGDVSTVTQRRS
jgi:hypothetical protein